MLSDYIYYQQFKNEARERQEKARRQNTAKNKNNRNRK